MYQAARTVPFPPAEIIHADHAHRLHGGSGVARTSRSTVRGLTAMPSAVACRAPGRPPSAKPWRRRLSCTRVVRRAQGATNAGTRSVKIMRGHGGWRQTNRRVCRVSTRGRPTQGRSASRRMYRLCTRRERRRHSGHRAPRRVIRATTCTAASPGTTCSTRSPGTWGNRRVVIRGTGVLLRPPGSTDARDDLGAFQPTASARTQQHLWETLFRCPPPPSARMARS